MLSITRTVLDTMAVEAAQILIDAFSSSKSDKCFRSMGVERGILACRE